MSDVTPFPTVLRHRAIQVIADLDHRGIEPTKTKLELAAIARYSGTLRYSQIGNVVHEAMKLAGLNPPPKRWRPTQADRQLERAVIAELIEADPTILSRELRRKVEQRLGRSAYTWEAFRATVSRTRGLLGVRMDERMVQDAIRARSA